MIIITNALTKERERERATGSVNNGIRQCLTKPVLPREPRIVDYDGCILLEII